MRFSLQTKLLLILLGVIGATVAIGTLAVNNRIEAGAQREADTQANGYAAQANALYQERAATLVAEGEAVSLYPAVIAALAEKNVLPLLTWSSQVTEIQGTKVTVMDGDGNVIARGHSPGQAGDNLAPKLTGLKLALAGQKSGGVEAGDELGLALRGYAPVRSNGRVVGAVMIADAVDDRLLARLAGAGGATTAIVTASDASVAEGCRLEGSSSTACSFPLNAPDGQPSAMMTLTVPLAAIDAARGESQQALWVSGGVVLVVGAVAAFILSRSLTRPLQTLTRSAERMSQGSYDEPLGAMTSRDEVGQLTTAFEAMRRQVHQATLALVEQRNVLDSVVEAMDAGVLLTDEQGETILANRRWPEMLGGGLAAAAHLTRPAGAPGIFGEAVPTWLTNAGTIAQADFEDFSGPYRRFRCYTAPVGPTRGYPAGQPAKGRIFVLRDVTAETEAERMRSAFVAMVSHELRSPLTAVKGYTETLLEAGPWDAATEREFLEIVSASAERLGVLIDNLLDAAQVEAGVLRLSQEPVRIERLVESVVKQQKARLTSHPLIVTTAQDLPLVNADPLRVEQVLTNLIENAVKYSPDGEPIEVSVEDQGMLTISVRDHGIGIGPDDQERVFERFFRAEARSGISPKGVGLGLFICRSLVEAHGGNIWVASKPGAGSTFTFTLPKLEEVDEPQDGSAVQDMRPTLVRAS